MSLELLYKNNINRKNEVIEYIDTDIILKTSIINYWNNYKIKIVIYSIIISTLLIIGFINRPNALIASLLFIVVLLLSFLFFNSYSIIEKENKLTIKTTDQNITIDYKDLKSIYLNKNTHRIFFKKYNTYNFVILYETKNHNICDFILPIILLKEPDIDKIFRKIKTKKTNINYKNKCIKYKRQQIFKKIILFLIFTILIIIFYFINSFSL